jgi:hypothetical protein
MRKNIKIFRFEDLRYISCLLYFIYASPFWNLYEKFNFIDLAGSLSYNRLPQEVHNIIIFPFLPSLSKMIKKAKIA